MANVRGYTSYKIEESLEDLKGRLDKDLNVIHSSIASLLGYVAAGKAEFASKDSAVVKDLFARIELLAQDCNVALDCAMKKVAKLEGGHRNLEKVHYATLDNLREMAQQLDGYKAMLAGDLGDSFDIEEPKNKRAKIETVGTSGQATSGEDDPSWNGAHFHYTGSWRDIEEAPAGHEDNPSWQSAYLHYM